MGEDGVKIEQKARGAERVGRVKLLNYNNNIIILYK